MKIVCNQKLFSGAGLYRLETVLIHFDPKDTDGLSLTIASTTEALPFASTFSRCFGIATLHVGRLRDLGLEIIADPMDTRKVLVTNLPFERPGNAAAEKLIGDVAKTARLAITCDHRR